VKYLGFRVAVIQPKTTNSFEKNLEKIKAFLEKVSTLEPDLVVLPEAWEHSNIFSAAYMLAERERHVIDVLAKHAVEMGAVIVGGGLVVYRRDGLRMAAPIIGPDGSVMGWQEKIHLHRSEQHLFRRGERVEVFWHKGICFGVQICVDVAFPELSRIMALRGAELIVNPSRMPSSAVKP
jgi:predicted amidohydrolase